MNVNKKIFRIVLLSALVIIYALLNKSKAHLSSPKLIQTDLADYKLLFEGKKKEAARPDNWKEIEPIKVKSILEKNSIRCIINAEQNILVDLMNRSELSNQRYIWHSLPSPSKIEWNITKLNTLNPEIIDLGIKATKIDGGNKIHIFYISASGNLTTLTIYKNDGVISWSNTFDSAYYHNHVSGMGNCR